MVIKIVMRAEHDFVNCSLHFRAELIKIVMRVELIKIVMRAEHENVNCSLQIRIRLLMFDEIVITISSELKSGSQFNHVINN